MEIIWNDTTMVTVLVISIQHVRFSTFSKRCDNLRLPRALNDLPSPSVLWLQVLLLDWGGTEKMNQSQLRSLPEHCQKIPPLALQCFLPDLRPTGDDSRWASSTCEFMADDLDGKFCFITQLKDSARESQDSGFMPVEVSVGSSARLFRNFRDLLLKQGLALPRKWKAIWNWFECGSGASTLPMSP
uniref:Tudor domain-containing protein n=1 Tax=Eptatretus burgeri TaxID=7764 RepID=A0A8C4NIK4_EPTBU